MALSPEERARIAEKERVRYQTNLKTSFGYLKRLGGCFALFLLLLVGTCTVLTVGINH